MAEFNINDIDKYGQQGNAGFFALADHGDVAEVRFVYNNISEFTGYSVHDIQVNGNKRYIDCIRTADEPTENCPLCASGMRPYVKFFIHVYDVGTDEMKIWDRGKTFHRTIVDLFNNHSNTDLPMVANIFEVERIGAKGDSNTKYEVYHMETDDAYIEDFPERTPILGEEGLVLDKTYEEIEFFLQNGYFEGMEPQYGRGSRDVQNDARGGRRGARRGETPPRRDVGASRRGAGDTSNPPPRRRTRSDESHNQQQEQSTTPPPRRRRTQNNGDTF